MSDPIDDLLNNPPPDCFVVVCTDKRVAVAGQATTINTAELGNMLGRAARAVRDAIASARERVRANDPDQISFFDSGFEAGRNETPVETSERHLMKPTGEDRR